MCWFYERPWCVDDIEECFDDIDDLCRYDMCFYDIPPRYLTRTRVRNGVRIEERVAIPHHRSFWRRRLGASYYPSRYYSRLLGVTMACRCQHARVTRQMLAIRAL